MKFGNSSFIPYIHILCFFISRTQWISNIWTKITGEDIEIHLEYVVFSGTLDEK